MISQTVISRSSAGNSGVLAQIDSYYQDSRDDYYAREDQPSLWHGKLAQELELSGTVNKLDFVQLMKGMHNGRQLRDTGSRRQDSNERLGIDLTFNAPKSVSLQALVGGDKRLIAAHNDAVAETLQHIEKMAETRKKVNKKSMVEQTGNLAVATFRHDTNRENEPHLHTHSIILNFTKRQDGEYRALHNEKIIKSIKEFSAFYQASLANKAKNLGYGIRHNGNGTFDLAHISPEQIKQFSSRSSMIEGELAKQGLDRKTATTQQKQKATLTTRKRKTEVNKDLVKQNWLDKSVSLQIRLDTSVLSPTFKENKPSHIKLDIQGHSKNPVDMQYGFKGGKSSHDPFELMAGSASLSQVASLNSISHSFQGATPDERANTQPQRDSGRSAATSTRQKAGNQQGDYTRIHHDNAGVHQHLQSGRKSGQPEGRVTSATNSYRVPNLSSFIVDEASRPAQVLLPDHPADELDYRGANHTTRLRWDHTGNLATAGSIAAELRQPLDTGILDKAPENRSIAARQKEPEENLHDIIHFDLPDQALTARWKDIAADIDFSKGKDHNRNNELLSEQEIVQLVIDHVTEKKVETTRQELIEQTLQKGLGLIGATRVNELLDEAEQQGHIVYLQSKFKSADEPDNAKAKSYQAWQRSILEKDPSLSEAAASHVLDQVIEKGRLVETEKIYTTPVHLQREQEILQQLSNGRTTDKILADPVLGQKLAQTSLNPEQKQAVSHILSTEQAIVGIQGYAGTGKSFMLNSAIALATEQQKDVVLLAPYGAQVKSLKDDGMDASTLASFLNSPKRQDAIGKDSVVIVDESGVINTKQMHQLLKIAEQQQAKVVLLGDVAQTKAVDAGSPFKLMQQHGMPTVTLSNIQRQKEPELKKAVVEAAYHRPEQSLKHLKHIAQIKDRHQRHEMIAEQYSQLTEDERKNTIVVSGRNIDRQDINQRIRDKLHLTGTGIQVDQLKRTQNTAAELTAVRTYKPGQYIEFVREPKNKQFSKGESYVIDQVDDRFIYVTDNAGKAQAINPKQQALNLYDKDKIELSHNDIIRVMQGEKEKDITTGDILKVIKATEKQIIGEDNKGNQHSFDSSKPLHLDHAYAMTVHSSQGLTVDRVIVNMDTKSRTTNKDVFYVAVSRARHEAYIYTDDNQQLPSAIRRESHKYNAHELMKKQHDNEMENLFKHDYSRH